MGRSLRQRERYAPKAMGPLMVAALVLAFTPPRQLADYVERPDNSFAWERQGDEIALRSQTWQDITWKHTLTLHRPAVSLRTDVAILVVTGDRVPRDEQEAKRLADVVGMRVATLYDVPNQPLFDDLREDALIGYSLVQALQTKDDTWPLLFPMTKSVMAAMRALSESTAGESEPIRRFIVTGASKRGWTTWLVGALKDPRVIGIAPALYDNLNIPAQIRAMRSQFGDTSEMIRDYTEAGLIEALETPAGQALARMVDPFAYRWDITVPKLIINGTNDPYWTVDAIQRYLPRLSWPTWITYLPNRGHDLDDAPRYMGSLAGFARALAGRRSLPTISTEVGRASIEVKSSATPSAVIVWAAETMEADFRRVNWTPIRRESPPPSTGGYQSTIDLGDPGRNRAIYVEHQFERDGIRVSLCTPISIQWVARADAVQAW